MKIFLTPNFAKILVLITKKIWQHKTPYFLRYDFSQVKHTFYCNSLLVYTKYFPLAKLCKNNRVIYEKLWTCKTSNFFRYHISKLKNSFYFSYLVTHIENFPDVKPSKNSAIIHGKTLNMYNLKLFSLSHFKSVEFFLFQFLSNAHSKFSWRQTLQNYSYHSRKKSESIKLYIFFAITFQK